MAGRCVDHPIRRFATRSPSARNGERGYENFVQVAAQSSPEQMHIRETVSMSRASTVPAPAPRLEASENSFKVRDGIPLFYRAWRPPGEVRRALILLHRGHEHSGRWQNTVETLANDDLAFFAWDARGHGRS